MAIAACVAIALTGVAPSSPRGIQGTATDLSAIVLTADEEKHTKHYDGIFSF
jgi:hypothetical protein